MAIQGTARRVGDHVSTDEILPGKYLSLTDRQQLARHALEGVALDPPGPLQRGDILVAGLNFGTGSSRQRAPVALREAGVAAVVAASFARIFFRNCINVGLPVIWCRDAHAAIEGGDPVEINTHDGVVTNLRSGWSARVRAQPDFVQEIIRHGGLLAYARSRIGSTLLPGSGSP